MVSVYRICPQITLAASFTEGFFPPIQVIHKELPLQPVQTDVVRSRFNFLWIMLAVAFGLSPYAWGASTFVPDFSIGDDYVKWYYGCGPTAGGSIASYWDRRGYSNLVQGVLEDNIASTRHIEYWYQTPPSNRGNTAAYGTANDPFVGSDGFDCIADFMGTSRYNYPKPTTGNYNNTNGGTIANSGSNDNYLDIRSGMKNYAAYRGYSIECVNNEHTSVGFGDGLLTWANFTAEIDAGRPVIFLVDSDGNGSTDHFVPVFGYNDSNQYFCYDEWGNTGGIGDGGRWSNFAGLGNAFGVGFMTTMGFGGSPEPQAVVLVIVCVTTGLPLTGRKRYRRCH